MITVTIGLGRPAKDYPASSKWIVDPNGTLHIREPNHNLLASYAKGCWFQVERSAR